MNIFYNHQPMEHSVNGKLTNGKYNGNLFPPPNRQGRPCYKLNVSLKVI